MNVIGLDHRGIRTSKLEESRRFYEDLVGLRCGPRPAALPSNGYWLYAGDRPIVHLVEGTDGSDDARTAPRHDLVNAGGQTHLALTVNGAREALARFRAADVPCWDRLFRDPLMYQVFVEDPNGLLIELIDRAPGDIDGPIGRVID